MEIVKLGARLLYSTPEPERLIELAGRTCYQSSHKRKACGRCGGSGDDDSIPALPKDVLPCEACGGYGTDKESAIAFVRMIRERGHDSVLEHPTATFSLTIDRGVSHEMVRHRIAAFSQESTRFCNYAKEAFGRHIRVVEPSWVGEDVDRVTASELWRKAMAEAETNYLVLLDLGQPPELARSVLPTCLKTELVMSANFREWRHVMRLRSSINTKAHPQMREVADMILMELKKISPVCFEDLR
jgi:thymidylate synthase (FAD)